MNSAPDTGKTVLRNWGTVGGLTFVSRIAGYARDLVVAYFLGAGFQSDAFYVAFRIPNLLRRLFAEGMLSAAFIPVFTEHIKKHGAQSAREGFSATLTVLLAALGTVTVLGVVFAPQIIRLFASGFETESFELAVSLLRLMFPYILLVSFAAISMGVLNSVGHFFAPAFSPLLFNLAFIAGVVFFHDQWSEPAIAAGLGVLAGGALQSAVNIPFLKSRGFAPQIGGVFKHSPLLKKIGVLMLPQLFGVAVYNLNIIVNTQYASYMERGTVSYLYFAERLTEFPLGIGAVAIATVFLPRLSARAADNDMEGFRTDYAGLLKMTLFITLPALAGLAALANPICSVLFERGEFTSSDALFSSQALVGYAAGVWAVAGIRITAPAFFALQDTKTPVRAAAAALVINLALGYLLGFSLDLKHTGLALASSVAAAVNFLILLRLLDKRVGKITARGFWVWFVKTAGASAMSAAVAKAVYEIAQTATPQTVALAVAIAVAFTVFILSTRILKIEEAGKLVGMVRGR
ncbi:MAG: murein biosynthesis integral membrane protein MurJ [Candidatus Mycalebacterium zealandia]|nr:MAG: murein biosynthesis integral membrane protein MurJ [Candidatus Mycalebacterium zealandia]